MESASKVPVNVIQATWTLIAANVKYGLYSLEYIIISKDALILDFPVNRWVFLAARVHNGILLI